MEYFDFSEYRKTGWKEAPDFWESAVPPADASAYVGEYCVSVGLRPGSVTWYDHPDNLPEGVTKALDVIEQCSKADSELRGYNEY